MRHLSLALFTMILASCGQGSMKTPQGTMNKFEEFKAKEKFVEDPRLFYPGIANPVMKPVLTEKINAAADDFMEVAMGAEPTDRK